jgi:hypothetical protein
VLFRRLQRSIAYLARQIFYWIQRGTGWGIDNALEEKLVDRTRSFLAEGDLRKGNQVPTRRVESIELSDSSRFRLTRDDSYKRFVALDDGTEVDEFGRNGRWVPRGCRIFHDHVEDTYIKVFDQYFCMRGEGRFLPTAFESGVYDFLCPALAYLIKDDHGNLRGYAIHSGQVLTPYEFERYVGSGLKEAICEITRQSGLYFYDLTYHNSIRRDDEISLIDLESVLPVGWYGQDKAFSMRMLQYIDIGFPIQDKFLSPDWYARYIEELPEQ